MTTRNRTRTALTLAAVALAILGLATTSANAAIVVEEQFIYEPPETDIDTLNGGTGFDGPWVSTISHGKIYWIHSPGLLFSTLPVAGNSLSRYGSSGRAEAHRSLSNASKSALTGNNTTMWFSALFQEPDSTYKHGSFLFGTDAFTTSGTPVLAASGYGFGFTIQRAPDGAYQGNGSINVLVFNGSIFPTVVAGTFTPSPIDSTCLIVGKINWKSNGTNDELFLFNVTDIYTEPAESAAIVSITNLDFNPSAFDTIALWDSNNAITDEIRLGNTFNDVMGNVVVLPSIPDVTGQLQATAEANLVAAGFIVGDVTTDYSDTVAAGYVISQSPVGHAASGTAIDLVVSLGLPIIPDVTGQPQATAEANIIAATFTVGVVTTVNSYTVPAGDVISQSAVGPATSGTTVDLVVSLGAPIISNVNEEPCIEGDIDGNCIVNLFDLALFFEQWLEDRYPFIESAGLVVIEAEHYLTNSPAGAHMWVAKDIAGSIGDGCVQALPDLGTIIDSDIETTSPHLTYEIDFSTTGTYYLWARGMADDASDDTIHYGVDGVAVSTGAGDSIQVSTDGTFEWSNGSGASINISSAETHTLDIWMREDGIIIDRLLLTTDSEYTPVQPDESASVTELIADLNGIDGVNMSDYAIISENWQDSSTPVIINEFMASNATTLDDADDDSSDWIEIYNRSEITVDMTDWYLTDDSTELNKWQFPAGLVLEPGEYAVIFASGKGDPSHPMYHPMHTNFELNAGGEYLGLCFPDQSVADEYSPEYPAQATDVSYGLFGSELQYFANPTPGKANQSGFFGLVPDTKFSIDRGFYDTSFSVAITCDDPCAVIRYTTDSEEPTDTSGTVYTGPITISGTTVLRAIASRPGWISSNVDTQTYIFVSDVKNQSPNVAPGTNWPNPGFAPGIICDRDNTICGTGVLQYMSYGMDPAIVTDPTYSGQIEDSLLSIPSMSISTNSDNLFDENTGIYVNAYGDTIEWERPASMELIYPDGTEGFQIDMGLRIRGAYSRMGNNPKHAFRCFFRGKYGDSKLRYPLFGEEGVDEFDKIDLRADQNYAWGFCGDARSTFCHEVFTRDTQAAMGQPYTRSRYYHLYLNGHYWGLFQTQERSEARYAKSYMGGEVEDYDVVKVSDHYMLEETDGNLDAYTDLYNAAVVTGFASNADYFRPQGKNPDGTENPGYEKLLDIDNVIAYNLMCYYFGGIDYPIGLKDDSKLMLNNLYGIYNRTNPDGWKFFIHDAEHSFGLREGGGGADRTRFLNFGASPYSGVLYFNPVWLHQELMDNAEYRIAFADGVHKHLFNGGALTEDKCFDRLDERLSQVGSAVIAESARWGDAQKRYLSVWHCGSVGTDSIAPLTESDWQSAIVRMSNFMVGRTNTVFNWIKNRTWLQYPSIDPPVLRINSVPHYGGYITMNDTLSMTNPNGSGTIYYTLDGSNPRLIGGAANPAATTGGAAVALNETTHVKARVKNGSEWSALSEAIYAIPMVAQNLRITELMYHPAGDPNAEFIEVMNIHPTDTINLALVRFTNGVYFEFPPYPLIAGQRAVVVQNLAAFETRYGTGINVVPGEYSGSLSNGGEEIDLDDALGTEIHDFDYSDGWYEITDGLGFSLTIRDPASSDPNDWDRKSGWRASFANGGSPGEDDSAFVLPENAVIVNELLAHADTLPTDWVEFYNTTDDPINIGGWFISDNDNDLMKYEIEESFIIPSHGYAVFYADPNFGQGSADPGSLTGFAFSESGEKVYLTSGSGGEITGVYSTERKFDPSAPDIAFGHYVKSTGGTDFVAMSSNTPGWLNASPKIPSVVINEIAYHPDTNGEAEFVELYNRSGSPVTLYDSVKGEPWRFVDDPDDPGVEFYFPSGSPITLAAGKYLLLVKDLTSFTSVFGAPSGADLQDTLEWDPGNGSLSNGGEQPELQTPGDPGYYIRVDRVTYDDEAPWPTEPDGSDVYTLQRKVPGDYGNDVANWEAASDTAGKDNATPP